MPRPQAGTPMDVALADVDTGIRLGIEGHSVRTAHTPVKYPSGGDAKIGLADPVRTGYCSGLDAGQGWRLEALPCRDPCDRHFRPAQLVGTHIPPPPN